MPHGIVRAAVPPILHMGYRGTNISKKKVRTEILRFQSSHVVPVGETFVI